MNAESFFKRPETVTFIEQARVATSMPVAVHDHAGVDESACIAGAGSCAACRSAGSTKDGLAACRKSRATAAAQALNRKRPVPFVCHLGLSCVAAPVISGVDTKCAITFGPFCPAEAPDGLEQTVAEGLEAVGVDKLPKLDDIARLSADGVPILVEWTADRLNALWREAEPIEEPASVSEDSDPEPSPMRREKSRARVPGPAPVIVVALAAGDRASARWFLRNALDEAAAIPGGGAQARAISLVSQVLEMADHARLPTRSAWERFNDFVVAGRGTAEPAQLSRACLRVLSPLMNEHRGRIAERIAIVFGEVVEGYGDGVLLEDAAAKAGADPTAITHLLIRRFALNFSELVGKVRVERAKQLLRCTQLNIAEIAHRVGVSDASNFGRVFRRFEGIAPLHYRERFRRAA